MSERREAVQLLDLIEQLAEFVLENLDPVEYVELFTHVAMVNSQANRLREIINGR